MFVHNFKYALKTLFKNRMLIFWTYAFPIILGTFFNMAFSGIESGETLDVIEIAVVDSDGFQQNNIFREALQVLSDEDSEDQLFHTRYVTENEAKKLLAEDEISGYLIFSDSDEDASSDMPKVVVAGSGINETILKYVTEEISQNTKMTTDLISAEIAAQMMAGNSEPDYDKIYKNALALIENTEGRIRNISSSNLSYTMIEFYTLIAMSCLYGGIIGMVAVNQNLANMCNNGKRVAVSPTKKSTLILGSVLAGYIAQVIGIALLFLYTIFVLKVDFGDNFTPVILLALVGCLAGLTFGIAVASALRTNDNTKTGIMIALTMLGCFFSGMMGITMKYVIDKNVPIINKLNPANMITDGFYSLYYYDTSTRFYLNVVSLLIFSAVMTIISVFCLRRQRYDSI